MLYNELTTNKETNRWSKKIIKVLLDKAEEDKAFEQKLMSSQQTLDQLEKYIITQAKAKTTTECAVIEDEEVYGWAIHFVDENITDVEEINYEVKVETPKEPEKKKEQPKQVDEKQQKLEDLYIGSLFDLDDL